MKTPDNAPPGPSLAELKDMYTYIQVKVTKEPKPKGRNRPT